MTNINLQTTLRKLKLTQLGIGIKNDIHKEFIHYLYQNIFLYDIFQKKEKMNIIYCEKTMRIYLNLDIVNYITDKYMDYFENDIMITLNNFITYYYKMSPDIHIYLFSKYKIFNNEIKTI